MNAKHTPGPWRVGKDYGAIVADVPTDGPNGADHVEAYGGYLVCESVARKNMPIIIAATDLLAALQNIVEMNPLLPMGMIEAAHKAIAKATIQQ